MWRLDVFTEIPVVKLMSSNAECVILKHFISHLIVVHMAKLYSKVVMSVGINYMVDFYFPVSQVCLEQ